MFEDLINVYKKAIKDTFRSVKFIPLLAILILALNLVLSLVGLIIRSEHRSVDLILGVVRYLISVMFASGIISVLENIIFYNRFSFSQLKEGFLTYLTPLLNTLFIFWALEMIVSMVVNSIGIYQVAYIASIAIYMLTSTQYEQIYIARTSGPDALVGSFNFIKENILHWIIPMLLYVVISIRFATFTGLAAYYPSLLLEALFYSLGMAFIYIFKGNLFKILHNSSRRKRKFEGMFD